MQTGLPRQAKTDLKSIFSVERGAFSVLGILQSASRKRQLPTFALLTF
jgi:hypothetical protein